MIKSIKLENGKEYRLFTSRMVIEVKTSRVHAETGWPIWMRVNGSRVISKVIAAISDADHAEALDMNAAIEWAKITPEQREIHDARVTFGISLKNKYNTDDVLEACHAEALVMNALIPAVARAVSKIDNADYQMQAMFWAANDYVARRNIVEAAHTEALNMDAARELNARQARFIFHNTAAERAEAIEAAHAAAFEMDSNTKI